MSLLNPIIVFLAVALWGFVHSITASLGAKARARQLLGDTADRYYRLIYNLVSLITFLPVLLVVVVLPDQPLYTVSSPWSTLMQIGQVLAFLVLILGVMQTDVWHFIGLKQLGDRSAGPPQLVVSGFYRWVRHPLYTAGLVLIWLQPVMTLNRLALTVGLTLYLVVGAFYEERKLLIEFGEAYQAYRRRTPMLIPWRKPV